MSAPLQVTKLPAVVGVKGAADIAAVHPSTVRKWIALKLLPASRRVAAGSSRVRIRTSDLLALLGLDDDHTTTQGQAARRRARKIQED